MNAYLLDAVHAPLMAVLELGESADRGVLESAILSGQLRYKDGTFSGHFSAVISKLLRGLGATLDPASATFHIDPMQLAPGALIVIRRAQEQARRTRRELVIILVAMIDHVSIAPETGVDFERWFRQIITDLNRQWRISAQVLGPQLDDADLDEELVSNFAILSGDELKLGTLDILKDLTRRLEKVEGDKGLQGLSDEIQLTDSELKKKAHGVAERNAARVVSAYRQARAKEVGSEGYIWVTCADDRVRPGHATLASHYFRWDTPPITNPHTGARNHPGEDFGCRCGASIVVQLGD